MNAAERKAYQSGYTFHGAYSSRDKESIKNTAAKLRKEGHKAIVVPAECGGHSVYWIESEESKKARAEQKRVDKYNQLTAEKLKLQLRLEEIEKELAQF